MEQALERLRDALRKAEKETDPKGQDVTKELAAYSLGKADGLGLAIQILEETRGGK